MRKGGKAERKEGEKESSLQTFSYLNNHKKCLLIVRRGYAPQFCLITTKIWSDRHQSPQRVTALGSRTDRVIALRQISVSAPCHSSILFRKQQENPSSRRKGEEKRVGECSSVRRGEAGREREKKPLAPGHLFLCFFLPLGLPYVNWASQERCLFYLRSSLWSWDLPLFYFHRVFPSLSLSHRHSGLLFPILTT